MKQTIRISIAKMLSCIALISAIIGTAALAIGSDAGIAPDYSKASCWHKLPMITKDVDTFYIYSTVYVDASFKEGAPDYATLDNIEMLLGVQGEYVTNARVYENSANVFVPHYRQAGMRYEGSFEEDRKP